MKISYKDIIGYLKKKPKINELSEILFQLGHEHEIEKNIFDFEFTPNRGDCLSVFGIARDLNNFFETSLQHNIYEKRIDDLKIKFQNESPEDCPIISFLKIEIKESPQKYEDYLERYFTDFNLNKVNFFTDISNYLAYEIGQPTHCYDFDTIEENLIFKKLNDSVEFETLLDQVVTLEGENCVFINKNNIINLAGIIGGKTTACKNSTKKVLVECALFNPKSIIGKAKKYDINSEASYKFERGTDPLMIDTALRRFIRIVEDHAEIIDLQIASFENDKPQERKIIRDLKKINKILGINLNDADIIKTLESVGFKINTKISIPSYRNDINHLNDLAEEVARIIGYDNIKSLPINIRNSNKVDKNIEYILEKNIKKALINEGFYEVINFPFVNNSSETSIEVVNPLDSNKKYFRRSLLDSLTENLEYNEKRQKDSIKLYEFSDIYTKDSNLDLTKKRVLGLIVSGREGHNYEDFQKIMDESYIRNLLNKIGVEIKDEYIRLITRENINIKQKSPIYFVEINLKDFSSPKDLNSDNKYSFETKNYVPISEYPSSYRDLSFAVDDFAKIKLIDDIIKNTVFSDLKEFFIFDYFVNKDSGVVKIGYRFIFQSNEKTLKDLDVDKQILKIINKSLKIEGITIPGLK